MRIFSSIQLDNIIVTVDLLFNRVTRCHVARSCFKRATTNSITLQKLMTPSFKALVMIVSSIICQKKT